MKNLLASLLLVLSSFAFAQGQPAVAVEGAWARSTVPGQDASGAYMTLTAREPLTLLGASTPAAGIVEIHEMKMVGDVMKMSAVESLALVPGKPVKLAPGGYHLMMMDLKQPLRVGTQIAVTLRLRDAQGAEKQLSVPVPVAAGARAH